MAEILVLLLAGILVPVWAQYNHDYQQPRYSDYADFGQYNSNEEQQQGHDFAVQQPSFFGSYSGKSDSDNRQGGSVGSVVSGSYGGLTPPPPTSPDQVNNVHKYFANERHAIVPSSLRELEESYIRSLKTGPVVTQKNTYVGPFGENRNPNPIQQQQDGVENYSGFIMSKRHYNKNGQLIRSTQQQHQHHPTSHQNQNSAQAAPITYGFPLLNQQVSATNTIDAPFKRKERGKFFDYPYKNIVPNFPDFSDRPPIPEEPEINDEEVEEATRKPPRNYAFPTAGSLGGITGSYSPSPLSSPPSIFDPSFPDPVLQRGFIPSFGPPTKEPFYPLKPGKAEALLHEQELLHNQIASQIDVSTTSPVPVLRPEYPKEKETNVIPDEESSVAPESTDDKPEEGTIYKHISVHVPAEDLEEELSSPKVVKIPKKPEKHIKVIFIKPPDSPSQKTEVEVPASPHQKTLVYVLSESGGTRTPIKLVTPTPLKPAPPQVFFLRYTDPAGEASQPTPTSAAGGEAFKPRGEGTVSRRPSTTPPIKQLASPFDPDAEILRTVPSPILPTYPSGFSTPATSAIAQQLSLQSTLSPPAIFSNTKLKNDITDPTNSRFHGASTSTNSLITDPNINSNHLSALKYSNSFPPVSSSVQSPASNPISPNYYSSLYHLYPPPAIASASVPNQNLLSLYLNPSNYQQLRQQSQSKYYPLLDQTKTGTEASPSSIQGLYTVAPNLENLPGINFNSLVQNPDGKNPPRSPRNFVMMNYAPTYMPSASGSDHAPVFTSPADFIKSLLGDSYMYYNNIGNNPNIAFNHTGQNEGFGTTTATTTTTTTAPTTTTSTTTPAPPKVNNHVAQNQAQHHTIPLILNWSHLNFSSLPGASPEHPQQPFTLVIGNSFDKLDSNNNANFHLQNAEPVYPHLRPLFPLTSTTTTPKPQARISWIQSTTTPPPVPTTTVQQQQFVQLRNIYEGDREETQDQKVINDDVASSHFHNLFSTIEHDRHGLVHLPHLNGTNAEDNEQSLEYYSQSESSSDETGDGELDEDSNTPPASGEEIILPYFEPVRVNVTSESGRASGGGSGYSSSITYVNSKNTSAKSSSGASSTSPKPGRRNRKRVNPAQVKPGRRLRKVRKPNKGKKNKDERNREHANRARDRSSSG